MAQSVSIIDEHVIFTQTWLNLPQNQKYREIETLQFREICAYRSRNGTSQNKHSNNAHRTRILVPLFTLNPPFLFPRGRASSNTFCLRVFTLSLPPRLSSREPTHFTVPDLRLATRGTTERGNYRGSDYLANRREIIARDASEGATFRAKIPLRGRSFLSNRSRYSAIFPPITAIGFDPSRDIHTFRMKL